MVYENHWKIWYTRMVKQNTRRYGLASRFRFHFLGSIIPIIIMTRFRENGSGYVTQ